MSYSNHFNLLSELFQVCSFFSIRLLARESDFMKVGVTMIKCHFLSSVSMIALDSAITTKH